MLSTAALSELWLVMRDHGEEGLSLLRFSPQSARRPTGWPRSSPCLPHPACRRQGAQRGGERGDAPAARRLDATELAAALRRVTVAVVEPHPICSGQGCYPYPARR